MIRLRTILLYDYIYILLATIAIIYSLLVIYLYPRNSLYNLDDEVIDGYIDNIIIDGDQLKIELLGKERIMVNYWFTSKMEKDNFDLCLGDRVKLVGTISKPRTNRVFNLFNYRQYLYYNGIHFLFNATSIERVASNNQLKYQVKQMIIKRINNIDKSKEYLTAFILGNNKNIDYEINRSYQTNGINHLFAISGMHVSFLALTILFLLKKLNIEEIKRYIMVMLMLLFYMFLTNYSPSVLRATLFFCLLSINSIYYLHIKTINILLLTLVILLLFNPYLIYSIGFQYSFMVSFYLILFQTLINKYNHYILKVLIVSSIAFLASIPISSFYFYQINIFSPLINIVFVPLVTFILLPLSLLTFFMPILDNILFIFIIIMEKLSIIINNFSIGVLIMAKPSILLIIIYYSFITLFLYKLKSNKYIYIIPLIITMVIHYNHNYFVRDPYIVFIDVGQGDCILINLPHNKGTLLIDTGGSFTFKREAWQIKNNQYQLGRDTIIPYLKSLGIKKIDYLILTHGHIDHMGEGFNIVQNFPVNKVIFDKGKLSAIKNNLIVKLDEMKINYSLMGSGDKIVINNYMFYILNPRSHINENDNSIVLYTVLNNHKILLTGDISSSIELDLINTYNLKDLDILKIAHHGSVTSSSEVFLDITNPRFAIIQVGLNNWYNHPSNIVMERLEEKDINTFLTSINGSIRFDLHNNSVTIVTVLP